MRRCARFSFGGCAPFFLFCFLRFFRLSLLKVMPCERSAKELADVHHVMCCFDC